MKKGLKIAIGVAVFAVIAIIVTFIIISKSSSKQAEEAWQSYVDLINNKDYAAMYNMLTDESKKKITEEDFTKRNKNIYEGISASDIKVDI
ncbi:MAG: NTF2-like N-terminal transpeptidase domain-containing protein, partial [Clostridiaceae bacterium]|nr:NTF2-like N-terminal transpeptidase domain-containing protein [Clostridiaceae bacterium]